MNEISVDNGPIIHEHSLAEQHAHVDDVQTENPTQNHSNAA